MKPNVVQYIQKLIKHASNIFSVISLLVALVAVLVAFLSKTPIAELIKILMPPDFFAGFSLVGACFSIIGAGYSAWKEAVEQLPKAADLMIKSRSVSFGSKRSRSGIPISPLRFLIKLDLINRGQETALLTELNVIDFKMNTELLGNKPHTDKLYQTDLPHGRKPIQLPYPISGQKWEHEIEYEIEVELHEQEPSEFAKRLNELQNYEIDIRYIYEDMGGSSHSASIPIRESFEKFRKQMKQNWKQNKQYELFAEAEDT